MGPCPAEARLGQWRKCLTAVTVRPGVVLRSARLDPAACCVRHAPSNFNRSQPSRVDLSSSSACGVPPPTANLERWSTFWRVVWVENARASRTRAQQCGLRSSPACRAMCWNCKVLTFEALIAVSVSCLFELLSFNDPETLAALLNMSSSICNLPMDIILLILQLSMP